MNRILMLEPKWHLSGWLASNLRDAGIGEMRWCLSWDEGLEAAGPLSGLVPDWCPQEILYQRLACTKPPRQQGLRGVAGVGFEPTTSGL
jgi:hypothetical protein